MRASSFLLIWSMICWAPSILFAVISAFFILRVLNAVQPVNFRNSITTSIIFHFFLLNYVSFQDLRVADRVALGVEDELVEMLDLVLLLEPLRLSIFKQMLVDSFSFKVDLIQRLALFTMNVDLLKSFFSLGGSGYRIVLFFPRHVHFGPDRLLRFHKGLLLNVLSHRLLQQNSSVSFLLWHNHISDQVFGNDLEHFGFPIRRSWLLVLVRSAKEQLVDLGGLGAHPVLA